MGDLSEYRRFIASKGTVALPPLIEVEEKRSGRIVIREWAGM